MATDSGTVLISDATLGELADVLSRPKFDRYVSVNERQDFLRLLHRVAEPVVVVDLVRACRDPKGDKFLELASNGLADVIISGDQDLLAMHPFRGIPVLTPAAFLGSRPDPEAGASYDSPLSEK